MSGHWIHRDADQHRCAKPTYEKGGKRGDIWKCDECGLEWIVTSVDYDQRDNCRWFVWQEREKWQAGPFPIGTK